MFVCAGSLLLRKNFLWLWRAGATPHHSTWASHCGGFSCRAEALGAWASAVVAWGLSRCSTWACGILPDQRFNQCPLHWQADSYPLYHQGSSYL